jgi:diketogulonate reductase-like aldo/keto reductase
MATGSFTLNTGAKIPAVGFGTWKAAPGDAAAAVQAAFEAGYRHFVRSHSYHMLPSRY